MNNGEKIKFIIPIKNYTQKDIANKLNIRENDLSERLNGNRRLRNIEILAISNLLKIPMKIFEDKNINSEEKIINFLENYEKKDKQETKQTDKKNDEILKDLCGEWYCYSYPTNEHIRDIWEDKIIIKDYNNIQNFRNNKLNCKGKIEINNLQSIITLKDKRSNLYLIFDNNKRFDDIFYINIFAKAISSNRDMMEFGIFSKKQLPLKIAKYILGDREKNQLIINYKFQERIVENFNFDSKEFLESKKTPYHKDNMLDKLLGRWYLSGYVITRKHFFEIDSDLNVKWYVNDQLQEKGKLIINTFHTLIEFIDERNETSYFLFKSMDREIKICCFKTKTGYDKHIIGIGILSREKLSRNIIEDILISEEKSQILIEEFRDRALHYLD